MSKKVAPKTAATPTKNSAFDGNKYVKPGVTIEDVNTAKQAFDLFDSDQGGSVDINCNLISS